MGNEKFCSHLINNGYATPEQIREARKFQQTTGGDLAQILIGMGVRAIHAYEAKAVQLGVPFVNLTVFRPDPDASLTVPEDVARQNNVLPIKKDGMYCTWRWQTQRTLWLSASCALFPAARCEGCLPTPMR